MTAHPQYLTVRNDRGAEMLACLPWASEDGGAASSGGGDQSGSGVVASPQPSAVDGAGGPTAGGAVFLRSPPVSRGDRRPWVLSTLLSDDAAKLGEGPEKGAPLFVGRFLAWLLSFFAPKGLEFAAYSVDYHTLRNWIYVQRHFGAEGTGGGGGGGGSGGNGGGNGDGGKASVANNNNNRNINARADRHVPSYAKKIVAEYEASSGGKVSARIPLRPKPAAFLKPGFAWGPGTPVAKRGEVEVRVGAKE